MSTHNYNLLLNSNRFYCNNDEHFYIRFASSLVLKNIEDYKLYSPKYLGEENIVTIIIDEKEKKISKFLIKDLIEDEGMYRYLLNNIDNDLEIVARIALVDNKYHPIELLKSDFLLALAKIEQEYLDNININVKFGIRLSLIKRTLLKSSENRKLSETEAIEEDSLLDKVQIPNNILCYLNNTPHDYYCPLEVALYAYMELIYTKSTFFNEENENTKNFILIFAKILRTLGITYSINKDKTSNNKIKFSSGEFLCSIDTYQELNLQDIIYTKINGKYYVLSSINELPISRKKFDELIKKVYCDYINDKQKEIEFEKQVANYKSKVNMPSLDYLSKTKLFLRAIARKDLSGIDNIDYINNIFNNIFHNVSDIKLDFLIPPKTLNKFSITPIAMVTINFNNNLKYILIDNKSKEVIKETSKEEIDELLEQGYYLCYGKSNYETRFDDNMLEIIREKAKNLNLMDKEKYESIVIILNDNKCFNKLDVRTSLSILNNLGYNSKKAIDIYLQLIRKECS